jgi:transposase-like protein
MSTREIQSQVRELDGIEISPERVMVVANAVHDEIKSWQDWPLEAWYAIVHVT